MMVWTGVRVMYYPGSAPVGAEASRGVKCLFLIFYAMHWTSLLQRCQTTRHCQPVACSARSAPFESGGGGGFWGRSSPLPPPSGAEIFEVPKAPKKIFDRLKARKKNLAQSFRGGGGGAPQSDAERLKGPLSAGQRDALATHKGSPWRNTCPPPPPRLPSTNLCTNSDSPVHAAPTLSTCACSTLLTSARETATGRTGTSSADEVLPPLRSVKFTKNNTRPSAGTSGTTKAKWGWGCGNAVRGYGTCVAGST